MHARQLVACVGCRMVGHAPKYGCNASGSSTAPSARWCVSNRAISIRGTAMAVPLTVCTYASDAEPYTHKRAYAHLSQLGQ
jgi:hypothetical protein